MKALNPLYRALYYVVVALAGLLVPILFPIRCFGGEHVKGKRQFVLAVNHPTPHDGLFVILARGLGKKMLVMGKPELFQRSRALSLFWYIAGLFPAVKGPGNKQMVEHIATEVQKGRGLMIFPEGVDTRDQTLQRLRSGAFVVAMKTGADIIPCRIGYPAGKAKLFHSVTVVFGAPISMAELGLAGEYTAAKLREAKRIFSTRLDALYEDYREVLTEHSEEMLRQE